MGIDHGDAGEDYVGGEYGEEGGLDVQTVLDHYYGCVTGSYCWSYEGDEGGRDVRAVLGGCDDVVEGRQGFFFYIWDGVYNCQISVSLLIFS